ncbi:rubrerythrin, partial [Burkholderia pseudomallei]
MHGAPAAAADLRIGPHKRSSGPAPRAPASEREAQMAQLKASKTEENLKYAYAGETQAKRRYLYFASKA